jgi:hypothetical protein
MDGSTKSISTYWNSCPLKNEYLPEDPCPEGTPEKEGNKIVQPGRCAWWINSKKHNYCFWKYLRDNSLQDGSIKEHSPAEIAELLGVDLIKSNNLLASAIKKITNLSSDYKLNEEVSSEDEFYNISSDTLVNSNDGDFE